MNVQEGIAWWVIPLFLLLLLVVVIGLFVWIRRRFFAEPDESVRDDGPPT